MSTRVLVLEDDADWVATYEMWLEPEGCEVRGVSRVPEALALAESWQPHVMLIDQKLEGPGGRNLGLSAIGQLRDRHPVGCSILVTGFATVDAVEQAFRFGASDYLEKNPLLKPLLRIKVRTLGEAAARSLDEVSVAERERLLHQAWSAAQTEANPQQKGRLLEETVRRLFESIAGFAHARTNVANETEEIDVLVTNRFTEPLLFRQGDFIIVECKNWSTVVGTPVISRLLDKVQKRYGRAKLGVSISMGGYASTVQNDLLAERRGTALILLLDAGEVQAWIDAPHREAWLVRRIERAVVEG